jgi:hypothetical protein
MIGMKAMNKDFLEMLIPPFQSIIELVNNKKAHPSPSGKK